jgi:hypothetical protein
MQELWRGKHVFTLDVVWDDKHWLMQVFENDEPCLLAEEFGKVNQLNQGYVKLIEKEIEKRIQEMIDLEKGGDRVDTGNFDLMTRSSLDQKPANRNSRSNSPSRKKNTQKLSQYKKIFQFLTPFETISEETMSCIDLKHRVCRILLPLLIDLNSTDQKIDFITFCCKMDALNKVLPGSDWNTLMTFQLNLRESSPEVKNKKFQRTLFNESLSKKY